MIGRVAVGVLALLIVACGGAPKGRTAHAPTSCGRDCRIYRGEPPAVPECRVPEDCRQPSHTQAMQCIAGGRCVPVCEHHWGDCDENFQNGCEQAIADRHYCPGDPRIGAVSEPSVWFRVHQDEATSTDPNTHVLARSLAAHSAELERCYRTALAQKPGLAGESTYRITFSEAGASERTERLTSATEDASLKRCEEAALSSTTIEQNGERQFIVEIVFAPGGQDTDAED